MPSFGIATGIGLTPEEYFFGLAGQPVGPPTPAPVMRNFAFANGTSSLISVDDPVSAAGDFDFDFESFVPSAADFSTIISGSGPENRVARINSNGTIRFYAGAMNINGTTDIRDGLLHRIRVTRVGTTLTLYIGGVQEATITNSAVLGEVIVTEFLRRSNGSAYVEGATANVNFISGWTQGGVAEANPSYEINGSDAGLAYNNFPPENIHGYTLSSDGTQWDQNEPVNPSLPNPLVIA